MRQPRAMLAILPHRLELSHVRQGQADIAAVAAGPSADRPAEWIHAMRASVGGLRSAVQSAGLRGAPVRVVYDSLTQKTDIRSHLDNQTSATDSDARSDALFEGSAAAAVTDACALPVADANPCRLLLGDTPEVLETIRECVEEAGLVFVDATPLSALTLASGVQAVSGEGSVVRVVLGETASFCLITHEGTLCFSRRLSVTVASMIDALASATGFDPTRDYELLREALFSIGLDRGKVHADPNAPDPADIAAGMQSALQRVLLEVRQSLRFGIDESKRAGLTLAVASPGAGVPGLAQAMTTEFDMPLKDEALADIKLSHASHQIAAMRNSVASQACRSLRSPSQHAERRQGAVRRSLAAGAIAAAAVVGADAWFWNQRADNLTGRLTQSTQADASSEATRNSSQFLLGEVQRWNAFEQQVLEQAPGRPSVAALLTAVAQAAPEGIHLRGFELRPGPDGVFAGSLNGESMVEATSDEDTLSQFAASLSASDVIRNVRLHNITTGAAGVSFTIRFDAPATPGPGATLLAKNTPERSEATP
ncbi:MAG: PilN domain-containing protein [Planctomycetota bacterium]